MALTSIVAYISFNHPLGAIVANQQKLKDNNNLDLKNKKHLSLGWKKPL
jgi:hypothetical protein